MAFILDDVIDEAQLLLNDIAGAQYTDTRLLALLIHAHRRLRDKLNRRGISANLKLTTVISVAANTASYDLTGVSDIVLPIRMEERQPGETFADWQHMERVNIIEPRQSLPVLQEWMYRDFKVFFTPASQAREIRIYYWGTLLPAAAAGSSQVTYLNTQTWLAFELAAVAAISIAQDETRASILKQEADQEMNELLSEFVKNKQSTPARRRNRLNRFL